MLKLTLGAVEARFADIVWQNAPLTTSELVNLCAEELNWKRTTTYTVLKKMCDGGIFKTENRQVTVVIPKDAYVAMQSEEFVEKTFQGSLPAFVAAFASCREISSQELEQIKNMIREFEEKK